MSSHRPILFASLALALSSGCDSPLAATRRRVERPVVTPEPPSEPAPSGDAPVMPTAEPGYHDLFVPGFGEAVVYVPSAPGPHAIVIAAHGNYDRPEWQCVAWHRLTRERAVILCPRGVARSDSPSADDIRFTYASQRAFNREVDAALASLRHNYGGNITSAPIVYAGFSLGAIFGVGYLRETTEPIAAASLVEGGHTLWTSGTARAFAARGGRAIAFGCGQAWCERDARAAQARLRAARIESEVGYAPGSGHSYIGAVADALRPGFERLVAPSLEAH